MLANLLPGLREVRAPLAAGYVLLLTLWLAFGDSLPAESEATGIYAAMLALGGAVTAIGLAAIVSGAAYLLGAISEGVLGRLWTGGFGFGGFFYTARVSPRGEAALRDLARRRADEIAERLRNVGQDLSAYARPAGTAALSELPSLLKEAEMSRGNAIEPPSDDEDADLRSELSRSMESRVLDELDLLRTRLLGTQGELFGAVDRMRSEAELRFSISAPLVALIGVVAVRDSWLWLFAVLAVAVLWRQGQKRLQESGDMLIDALRVGRVDAPSLERLAGELDRVDPEGAQEIRDDRADVRGFGTAVGANGSPLE